jgi:HPt (histidine-containing phosphotransfer) domain-containing protein
MAKTFDEQELLDRVDNDVGFLAETVQMLETDGRSLVAEIRLALVAADAATVARCAHALKGMISNFCSPQAQACAFDIEKMGKNGDLSSAPGAVELLGDRLNDLIVELLDFVKART